MENIIGAEADDWLALAAKPAGPASLRQGRGARRPQDGPHHAIACPAMTDGWRCGLSFRVHRGAPPMTFVIEPHFRLQEWVADEKGYFRDEGLDYVFQELIQSTGGQASRQGRQGRRLSIVRKGPHRRHQLRLPLDGRHRRGVGPRQAVPGRLFGDAVGRVRARGFAHPHARGSGRRAHFGGLPVGQPLRHHPGAGTISAARQDRAELRRRHAVRADGEIHRRPVARGDAVLRALLLRRATGLSQDPRHHLRDRHHDHRHPDAEDLPNSSARSSGRSATSISGPISTPTIMRANFPSAFTRAWIRGAGARASGWCSSPTRAKCSTTR